MIAVSMNPEVETMKERCRAFLRELQNGICEALEGDDGKSFREDSWQRPGGGGGASGQEMRDDLAIAERDTLTVRVEETHTGARQMVLWRVEQQPEE